MCVTTRAAPWAFGLHAFGVQALAFRSATASCHCCAERRILSARGQWRSFATLSRDRTDAPFQERVKGKG